MEKGMLEVERKRLKEIIKERSFRYGDFVLSSGLNSKYYFDGRLTTLWPMGVFLVGRQFYARLQNIDVVGGPTLGADAIVTAVAMTSYMEGKPIPAFIVRKEPKCHGMGKLIEGCFPTGAVVAVVDDVLSTGKTLFDSIKVVQSEGCKIGKVIVLLDRQQGGSEELREKGYEVDAIFVADDDGNIS